MTPAEKLVEWAIQQVGCPYIIGARGQKCLPDYRRYVYNRGTEYSAKVKANCNVLSGRKPTCAGCKWGQRPSYDCRGLTAKGVFEATGRTTMGGGSSSQWHDDSNWAEKGLIQDMPDKPCIVFRGDGNSFPHTGIYIGNKTSIHSSGHSVGVIKSGFPYTWTHYAIPVGMYAQETTPDRFRAFAKQLTEIADTLEGIKMLYQAKINTRFDAGLGLYKTMNKLGGKVRDIVKGEIVNVTQEMNADWARVEYKGFVGYVDRQYLAKYAPPVPPKPVDPALILRIRTAAKEQIAIADELEKLN